MISKYFYIDCGREYRRIKFDLTQHNNGIFWAKQITVNPYITTVNVVRLMGTQYIGFLTKDVVDISNLKRYRFHKKTNPHIVIDFEEHHLKNIDF